MRQGNPQRLRGVGGLSHPDQHACDTHLSDSFSNEAWEVPKWLVCMIGAACFAVYLKVLPGGMHLLNPWHAHTRIGSMHVVYRPSLSITASHHQNMLGTVNSSLSGANEPHLSSSTLRCAVSSNGCQTGNEWNVCKHPEMASTKLGSAPKGVWGMHCCNDCIS